MRRAEKKAATVTCIWCKREVSGKQPIEHIIPDSLGCPEDMVLRDGEVCGRCNNKLARLDQTLISEFEMVRFRAGVPTKHSRFPTIATKGSLRGFYKKDGEPHIEVNLDPHPVQTPDGSGLAAYRAGANGISLKVDGLPAGVMFEVRQSGICNSVRAVRALHKIGLAAYAKRHGDAALAAQFDSVRNYVTRGEGNRIAFIADIFPPNQYATQVNYADGSVLPESVVCIRIARLGFFVDLSSAQSAVPKIKSILADFGNRGMSWTWTPIADIPATATR